MFEFTVPDGDYDYDYKTNTYHWKPLVFMEKKKNARKTVEEYVEDNTPFTMVFKPKEM